MSLSIQYVDEGLAEDEVPYWRATSASLDERLDVDDHNEAQELVKAMLDGPAAAKVDFDSESGQFFAYADTREPLEAVEQVVILLAEDKGYREEAEYRAWGDRP